MAQPATESRFRRLQSYLADGWAIDPPIFVRPVWHSPVAAKDAYHFVLKRSGDLQLLVIPATEEIERFVSDHRFPLNRL